MKFSHSNALCIIFSYSILLLKLMVGQAVGCVGNVYLFLPIINKLHVVSTSGLGVLD